jgi:hypothetical protein
MAHKILTLSLLDSEMAAGHETVGTWWPNLAANSNR